MKNVKSEKLILENYTDLPMETFLRFALEVVKMGRVSNNDRQYCWVTTFEIDGKTYVVSSKLNKKSDKLTLYEYNLYQGEN